MWSELALRFVCPEPELYVFTHISGSVKGSRAREASYFYQQAVAFAQSPLMPALHAQPYVSESQDDTYWRARRQTLSLSRSLSVSLHILGDAKCPEVDTHTHTIPHLSARSDL